MRRLRSLLSALKPTRLGVLFAVLIGVGVGFWQWGRPPRPRVVLENLQGGLDTYFSRDGRILATVHCIDPDEPDYLLTLWDARTGRKKLELSRGQGPWAVAFSPDGKTVAGRFWLQVRVWDIATGRQLANYPDKDGLKHFQLVYSPDGKLLALRKNYELWDVAANKIVKRLALEGEEGKAWAHNFLVLAKENKVRVWDLSTATLCFECEDIAIPWNWHSTHPGSIVRPRNVEISMDNRYLIINGSEDSVVYDVVTAKSLQFWKDDMRLTAAVSSDGKVIALSRRNWVQSSEKNPWWAWFRDWLGIQEKSTGFQVTLNVLPSGVEMIRLKDCHSPLFSPDGQSLAVSGVDGTSLQLWDLPIRKPIGKILGLAGLAAVATLSAINGLGRLRRRRIAE
jgi:WD40 repeat protein